MTISYNLNLPFASDYPGDDQPGMLQNTNSISAWVAVNHVGFNTAGTPPGGAGGQHTVIDFDNKYPPPAMPAITDPQSALYTDDGEATPISQLYFRNQFATYTVNIIKAYCVFVGVTAPAVPVFTNSFNCVSISKSGSGQFYNIVLSPNCVTGNDIGVLATNDFFNATNPSWSYNSGTMTLRISVDPGVTLTVAVLQA